MHDGRNSVVQDNVLLKVVKTERMKRVDIESQGCCAHITLMYFFLTKINNMSLYTF